MPTRVVLLCDSDPRPPSRLGRVSRGAVGSGWVLGVCVLGARGGLRICKM